MENKPTLERPPFEQALSAWQEVLRERGFPAECAWIFGENLCFEQDPSAPKGFRLGVQTRFTPVPPDAERLAYDYFSDFHQRLVFYRLGSTGGKSVCLLLCDQWFEDKAEADGYLRRNEWLVSFYPGSKEQVEEITDKERWEKRVIRERPLHDLDFCMDLRAIHEILAHGRVLSTYEHYALKFLHLWRRMLGRPD